MPEKYAPKDLLLLLNAVCEKADVDLTRKGLEAVCFRINRDGRSKENLPILNVRYLDESLWKRFV